jgi:hypothetical protein
MCTVRGGEEIARSKSEETSLVLGLAAEKRRERDNDKNKQLEMAVNVWRGNKGPTRLLQVRITRLQVTRSFRVELRQKTRCLRVPFVEKACSAASVAVFYTSLPNRPDQFTCIH